MADVNKAMDNGATPPFISAQNVHEAIVRALIEFAADVNREKDDGGMPLITGAQNGHEAIVRVLREAGADVNKAADNGGTPLYIAAQRNHGDSAGADRVWRGRKPGNGLRRDAADHRRSSGT